MTKRTSHQPHEVIANGIFYTPEAVASELASGAKELLSGRSRLRILDPSCGAGALLEATEKEIGASHTFHGCDIFGSEDFRRDRNWRFTKSDFFDYSNAQRFDLIVTNPPYIASARIPEDKRRALFRRYFKTAPLNHLSDLWVYFLLKSIDHLRLGGTISAVIPWAFLEAGYAHPIRAWLAERFTDIRVLVLRDRHFESTEKRVLLLWLSGYGQDNKTIQMGFSDRVDEEHVYTTVDRETWSRDGLIGSVDLDTDSLLKEAATSGFRPLSDLASVTIGVVTGANKFFILPKADARRHGFTNGSALPILTSVADTLGVTSVPRPEQALLQFSRDSQKRQKYIGSGIRKEFHLRSHCQRRTGLRQWYQVDPGPVPDAFFTYRVSTIPYMSLNPDGFQCTNTLHKVSFHKGVTDQQKQWIATSILSDISQLCFEHYGRHYGNGILKIEPSALKKSLVFCPPRRSISEVDMQMVSELLGDGNKQEASILASSLIRRASRLPSSYWSKVRETLMTLRERRA